MTIFRAYLAGLGVAHLAWFYFFATGHLLRSNALKEWREITLLSLVMLALSLPWYIRNAIESADPTPPIFNFYFNHPDPIFTQADSRIYVADTLTDSRPLHLLLLPFRFFVHPP
jgi:hypothetical protein